MLVLTCHPRHRPVVPPRPDTHRFRAGMASSVGCQDSLPKAAGGAMAVLLLAHRPCQECHKIRHRLLEVHAEELAATVEGYQAARWRIFRLWKGVRLVVHRVLLNACFEGRARLREQASEGSSSD